MQDSAAMHGSGAPSAWVRRWAGLIRPGGTVLDLAAGLGRHARFLAGLGLGVLAVDRDAAALATLDGHAGIETAVLDLEDGPWPLGGRRFAAVIVTNYLWRPRFGELLACLAPGGVLIYETFARGQEQLGRPTRAEFLLESGELYARVAPHGTVVAYEYGLREEPRAVVQRIVAISGGDGDPPAATLSPG